MLKGIKCGEITSAVMKAEVDPNDGRACPMVHRRAKLGRLDKQIGHIG